MIPAWNRKQPGSYDCTVQPLSGRYRISATSQRIKTFLRQQTRHRDETVLCWCRGHCNLPLPVAREASVQAVPRYFVSLDSDPAPENFLIQFCIDIIDI